MTRGWSPVLIDQTHPALKKKENFKEVLIHNHSQQIFSADFFSRVSQQIFLSRSSQQIFSADLLICCGQGLVVSYCLILSVSSFAIVRGWWSANFKEVLIHNHSQQIFSADLLSRFSQQSFSADLSQQIFSADLLSRSSQQIFSFAVVRGWWSAIVLSYHSHHLLWSGVGGQLLSYHLLWSGVGGQLLSYHVGGLYCMSSLEGPFRGAFGKKKRWPHLKFHILLHQFLCKACDTLLQEIP